MSKEDGTLDLTRPDPKDAMSKLNELIALRFDEETNSNDSVSDNISLKSVVKEVLASPEEITAKHISPIAVDTDVKHLGANNATGILLEQPITIESEDKDADQELKNRLNELAATGFGEVPYESCELKIEEYKPEVSAVTSNELHLPTPVFTKENNLVQTIASQSTAHQKGNTIQEKKEFVDPASSKNNLQTDVVVSNDKNQKVAVPDIERTGQVSSKATMGIIRDSGTKPAKIEDTVSIIDALDSIESEMKKKELSMSDQMHTVPSKKNLILTKDDIHKKASSANIQAQKVSKSDLDAPVKVAVVYSEGHDAHFPKNTNIEIMERPERLTKAMIYLERSGVFGERCDLVKDKHYASEADLLQVHSEEYVKFVKSYSASGGGFLGDSTYMTSHSFEVTTLAAGAAIHAGELVLSGKYSAAMAIIRPPGHHAGIDKYRGFCIFNNVAVLARYLQKKKGIGKVMIIDWDAHAGDGTMEIFYNDPTVMVLSLHRDPHDFYPRKGFSSQIGEGQGKGYTANVEMPMGAGDEEYAFAFDEFVLPVMRRFSPDFVICSCGFDAYYKEQHIKLNLTSAGYHMMTQKVMSVMNGNFVLVMEGGYHKFNGHLAHVVINSLLGLPDPISDTLKTTEYERNQQKAVMKETEKKIAYAKEMLGIQV
jgi:acetoin utilization deacetylase AcuC-like enzyme